MSLSTSLNIASTALAINQAAIQTVGNNISNVGNENYTRQKVDLSTQRDQKYRHGVYIGSGVQLDAISRQIDEALESRLRNTRSENESADVVQGWLGRVEGVFNELSDEDLSSQLSKFFNSWNDLANKPQDMGLRQVVVQNGQSVTSWFNKMNASMESLNSDLNDKINGAALKADELATKIAAINVQIAQMESGQGPSANALRDQRDTMLKDLSNLMDIRTVEQKNGVVNVYIGSEPLVFDGMSRGVTTRTETDANGRTATMVVYKSNGGEIKSEHGVIGGLMKVRESFYASSDQFNQLASSLTFELNKIHSAGQGLEGFTQVIGSTTLTDSTVALTDADSGLRQIPSSGSFVIHVKDKATGMTTSTMVKVDLDGTGTDDSLDAVIAKIDAVAGVTAVNNGGRLQINADNAPASEISFSQDSSGVLAAMGVNTFFTGTDAKTIQVSASIQTKPQLIAAAMNGNSGDNQTARAIAAMETMPLTSLGGSTLQGCYESMVNSIATQSTTASAAAEAAKASLETLQAQHEAVSGVSMDEEAINLMRYQRAFQGAARLVSVVNEMMDTMLGLVR